jgi:hypothetical protein
LRINETTRVKGRCSQDQSEVLAVIVESPRILSDRKAVGLVCKPGRIEVERIANRITEFLLTKDIDVQVDPGSCNVTAKKTAPTPIEDMDVDFVVTIGGDGTILYALSRLGFVYRNHSTWFSIN